MSEVYQCHIYNAYYFMVWDIKGVYNELLSKVYQCHMYNDYLNMVWDKKGDYNE